MLVTELTSQLERSELKEEAERNTVREKWVRARNRHSASQREAGRRDALPYMLVTELTFQLDTSELKEEALLNTAREKIGESTEAGTRQAKGGWAEGRTLIHADNGADVPARQVGIEGGGFAEHCARGGG